MSHSSRSRTTTAIRALSPRPPLPFFVSVVRMSWRRAFGALCLPSRGSPLVQSRRPLARAFPLAAARSATFPVASRSPPQAAERKSQRLFPPALRNKIFTLGDLFRVLGAVARGSLSPLSHRLDGAP
ncbi:hypothetical protein C8J57DRAFT_1497469 [Mycena rebaudengoi]|nr:hypothetical protein C8J57DRAFT_1497469 [Mycena rebaudengoi]